MAQQAETNPANDNEMSIAEMFEKAVRDLKREQARQRRAGRRSFWM